MPIIRTKYGMPLKTTTRCPFRDSHSRSRPFFAIGTHIYCSYIVDQKWQHRSVASSHIYTMGNAESDETSAISGTQSRRTNYSTLSRCSTFAHSSTRSLSVSPINSHIDDDVFHRRLAFRGDSFTHR